MLGMQSEVAVLEPLGGAAMQGTAVLRQERPIDRIADQRVHEEIVLPMGPQEVLLDKFGRVEARARGEPAQKRRVHPLADHRGRLDRLLISRRELIDARLHEALDAAGHGLALGLLRMTQELLEEKRVAAGARHQAVDLRLVVKRRRADERIRYESDHGSDYENAEA